MINAAPPLLAIFLSLSRFCKSLSLFPLSFPVSLALKGLHSSLKADVCVYICVCGCVRVSSIMSEVSQHLFDKAKAPSCNYSVVNSGTA